MPLIGCLLVLVLLWGGGCASPPPKDAATLSINLAATPDLPPERRINLLVRTPALSVQVDRLSVLTEGHLEEVEVVPDGDLCEMRLVFNTRGTIVLDEMTLNHSGQLVVILIDGTPIAAPMLREHIVDGTFTFTPDVTCEEAEKIASALRQSIAYLRKRR